MIDKEQMLREILGEYIECVTAFDEPPMLQFDYKGLARAVIGEPLSGHLFGRGIVILALNMELSGQEEIERGIDPKWITLDRYVPIDNWWDEVIEAMYARVHQEALDNHKE